MRTALATPALALASTGVAGRHAATVQAASPRRRAAADPGHQARLYQRYCDKLREGPEAYAAFVKRWRRHRLHVHRFAPRDATTWSATPAVSHPRRGRRARAARRLAPGVRSGGTGRLERMTIAQEEALAADRGGSACSTSPSRGSCPTSSSATRSRARRGAPQKLLLCLNRLGGGGPARKCARRNARRRRAPRLRTDGPIRRAHGTSVVASFLRSASGRGRCGCGDRVKAPGWGQRNAVDAAFPYAVVGGNLDHDVVP